MTDSVVATIFGGGGGGGGGGGLSYIPGSTSHSLGSDLF